MRSFSILNFICNGKSVLTFSKEQVEKLMGYTATAVYKCVNINSIVCETSDCVDMIYTKDGMKILAGMIFFNHNIVKIGKIPLEWC